MSVYNSLGQIRNPIQPLLNCTIPGHIGTSIGAVDYIANCQNMTALTTSTYTTGTLYAVPFIAPHRGATLSRIAAEVSTLLAASNIRLGLYSNKSQVSMYPNALLEDSGNLSSASTGVKTYAVTRVLTPGEIYWLTLNVSSSATLALRTVAVAGCTHFLGMATAGTTALNTAISVASAFGANPDPYPGSGAYRTGVIPVLRYQFSA